MEVPYKDLVQRHRVIAADYIEIDWLAMLCLHGCSYVCPYSGAYSNVFIVVEFHCHAGRFVQKLCTVVVFCHRGHTYVPMYTVEHMDVL